MTEPTREELQALLDHVQIQQIALGLKLERLEQIGKVLRGGVSVLSLLTAFLCFQLLLFAMGAFDTPCPKP